MGQAGNKVSAMFTSLATQIDDPVERLRAIVSVTEGDDKPLKYPHMFAAADLVGLNKARDCRADAIARAGSERANLLAEANRGAIVAITASR